MTERCNSCGEQFADFKALALHIMTLKKGHRKGRVWASKFLAQVNKKKFSPRSPMSEETRQIIKECVRETSGASEAARTVCPNCKLVTEQRIEVEYVRDDLAWRNSNGTLVVNCDSCKRER
jgi:hypothetical protein